MPRMSGVVNKTAVMAQNTAVGRVASSRPGTADGVYVDVEIFGTGKLVLGVLYRRAFPAGQKPDGQTVSMVRVGGRWTIL